MLSLIQNKPDLESICLLRILMDRKSLTIKGILLRIFPFIPDIILANHLYPEFIQKVKCSLLSNRISPDNSGNDSSSLEICIMNARALLRNFTEIIIHPITMVELYESFDFKKPGGRHERYSTTKKGKTTEVDHL